MGLAVSRVRPLTTSIWKVLDKYLEEREGFEGWVRKNDDLIGIMGRYSRLNELG